MADAPLTHDALDEDSLARDVADLIRIPSITGTRAESELQHHLADRLRQLGCNVDLWQIDLPTITSDPHFPGMEAPRSEAWGLVGELTPPAHAAAVQNPYAQDPNVPGTNVQPDDAPTVILNAHVDVVPPGDRHLWSHDPFDPRDAVGPDGRRAVFGRGACDMKGGLVSILAALKLLRENGYPRRGRVLAQFVVGEEDGGLGTFATLRRGHLGSFALIPEPTSCTIVPAAAGALTFRLTVPGLSAHGSSRLDGVSALEALWPVWQAIRELEAYRNADAGPLFDDVPMPFGISIGTVHAGDWASTVPDRLVAEGRYGVRLGEDVNEARAALVNAVAAACSRDPWLSGHPATVEFFGGQFASASIPVDHPLVHALSTAHWRTSGGGMAATRGIPAGTDLRLLAAAGIPGAHYGPGALRYAHAPDEFVPVADVAQTARVLVDVVSQYCG
jgi:acetylornithine deacetylase